MNTQAPLPDIQWNINIHPWHEDLGWGLFSELLCECKVVADPWLRWFVVCACFIGHQPQYQQPPLWKKRGASSCCSGHPLALKALMRHTTIVNRMSASDTNSAQLHARMQAPNLPPRLLLRVHLDVGVGLQGLLKGLIPPETHCSVPVVVNRCCAVHLVHCHAAQQ